MFHFDSNEVLYRILILKALFFSILVSNWNFSLITAKADTGTPLNFSASGFVVNQYINRNDGKLAWCETNQFQCDVSNGLYSIQISVTPRINNKVRAIECVFDGTNVYSTTRYSTNLASSVTELRNGKFVTKQLEKPKKAANDANLEISTGPVPPFTSGRALTLIWLGLASQSYYNEGELLHRPFYVNDYLFYKYPIQLKALLKKSDKSPGFFERIEEYNEGFRYSEKGSVVVKTPLSGAGGSGYTNSVFSTVEWIDVSGFSFPKHMQLQCFYPTLSGAIGLSGFTEAYITSVNLGDGTNAFAPDVKPRTMITETRGDVKNRVYYSTNGAVLSLSELKNDPNHGRKVK